ncbi:MAG: isocitrate lyase/phosphoenolpyruvate mutase family protein [Hyphomicrobiales bacterium]
MTLQSERAEIFRNLHIKGKPVILFNIWDAGSATTVAGAGAHAIATGSAPVAMANGFTDGEKIPMSSALENATRIVNAVNLPVTLDFEGAYSAEPKGIATNVSKALQTGIVGFNFEDQIVGEAGLYDIGVQSQRVAAMRSACQSEGIDAFINARTDIFLKAKADTHSDAMLDEAITRGKAYEDSGASGFFVPGLVDEALIEKLCEQVTLPVNIIALPGAPSNARLADLGVARISYGPVPYRKMVSWMTEEAKKVLGDL